MTPPVSWALLASPRSPLLGGGRGAQPTVEPGPLQGVGPRQGEVVLSAELGFWTVSGKDGNQFIAGTEPALGLVVQPRLRRLASSWAWRWGPSPSTTWPMGPTCSHSPPFRPRSPCAPFSGLRIAQEMLRAGWPSVPESPPGRGRGGGGGTGWGRGPGKPGARGHGHGLPAPELQQKTVASP